MKLSLALIASMFVSMTASASQPVTKIPSFICHPRGGQGNLMVWTEKAGTKQVITVGKLGASGFEGFEKFTGTRMHLDDIVTVQSNDGLLKVGISNDFDGEFYAGDLTWKKDNREIFQELACEEYSNIPGS
jgi:hypothetical protein